MANRSLKKPPFVSYKLLKKVSETKPNPNKPIKTWSRSSTIYPDFVGYVIAVHNGKQFINVTVTDEKVGHKLGEFSPTRKHPNHKVKLDSKGKK